MDNKRFSIEEPFSFNGKSTKFKSEPETCSWNGSLNNKCNDVDFDRNIKQETVSLNGTLTKVKSEPETGQYIDSVNNKFDGDVDFKRNIKEEPLSLIGTLTEVKSEPETDSYYDSVDKKYDDDVDYKRGIFKEEPLCLIGVLTKVKSESGTGLCNEYMDYRCNKIGALTSDVKQAKEIIVMNFNGDDKTEIKEESLWPEVNYDGENLSSSDDDLHIVEEESAPDLPVARSSMESSRLPGEAVSNTTCLSSNFVADIGHLKQENNTSCAKKCRICKKHFKTKSDLKYHSLTHNETEFKCEMCEKTFNYFQGWNYHTRIHRKKGNYTCQVCEETFRAFADLNNHILVHKNNNEWECHICKRSYKSFSLLNRHMPVHKYERPHRCEVCGKSFQYLLNLQKHKLNYYEIQYTCVACNKSFTEEKDLRSHYLMHQGKKTFKCGICGKTTRINCYVKHFRCHKKEGTYRIKLCDNKLVYLEDLTAHCFIHNTVGRIEKL